MTYNSSIRLFGLGAGIGGPIGGWINDVFGWYGQNGLVLSCYLS